MPTADKTVTYWGISIFSSRTFWVNCAAFLVAASSLTEVTTMIPPAWLPMLGAVTAMANVWLRTNTVRPATFIKPGTTEPTEVKKLQPSPPAPTVGITD